VRLCCGTLGTRHAARGGRGAGQQGHQAAAWRGSRAPAAWCPPAWRGSRAQAAWCPPAWRGSRAPAAWCPPAWRGSRAQAAWCPPAWRGSRAPAAWCPPAWRGSRAPAAWCPPAWRGSRAQAAWCPPAWRGEGLQAACALAASRYRGVERRGPGYEGCPRRIEASRGLCALEASRGGLCREAVCAEGQEASRGGLCTALVHQWAGAAWRGAGEDTEGTGCWDLLGPCSRVATGTEEACSVHAAPEQVPAAAASIGARPAGLVTRGSKQPRGGLAARTQRVCSPSSA
jgi:hypothetical protein